MIRWMRETFIGRVVDAGGRLTVRSALNPILWLCAIVTLPTIGLGVLYGEFPTWLILIASSPVVMACVGFLFLLVFDRDKLQSEDYQLRKQTLELAQEKGDPVPIEIVSHYAIENPDKPTSQIRDDSK